MKVLKEQCATCIFRPGNLMDLNPGRVSEMVRECRRTQAYIPCHETLVFDDDDEEGEHGDGPVCRGFYDQMGEVSQMIRIAERLGCLEFVTQNPAR